MNVLSRLFREEEGQALTEYGLIIGLIAIVCIAAIGFMGEGIKDILQAIGTKLTNTATNIN